MRRFLFTTLALLIVINFVGSSLFAQGGGAYGGGGGYSGSYNAGNSAGAQNLGKLLSQSSILDLRLQNKTALNAIMIEGTAEFRIQPEQLRVVLALTSEGDSAQACQEQINKQIAAIRKDWLALQIPEKDIVEDFISVLPRYEWTTDKWEEENIRVQKHNGYRMQSNLHVAVNNETEAMAAIDKAFQHGVAEVVTFDYWSSKLDEEKQKAMTAAVEAARKKSKTLLAVFSEPPQVINVQEKTTVIFPTSLYTTYQNVLEEDYLGRYWQERARIKAYRPKMTFYRGLDSNADIKPKELPMRPEIAVVSTVRIYYQSPAERDGDE